MMLVGKEVGKDLMEDLNGLVDGAEKFATGSILMPAAIEIAGTNIAHREVALGTA